MQECERLLAHLVACELYHSCSAAQTNRGRSCSRSSVMVAHMHLRSCLVCRHWSCRSVLRRRCPVLRWTFLGSRFRTGTAGTGGRKQSRLLSLCSDAAWLLRLTCRAAVNTCRSLVLEGLSRSSAGWSPTCRAQFSPTTCHPTNTPWSVPADVALPVPPIR